MDKLSFPARILSIASKLAELWPFLFGGGGSATSLYGPIVACCTFYGADQNLELLPRQNYWRCKLEICNAGGQLSEVNLCKISAQHLENSGSASAFGVRVFPKAKYQLDNSGKSSKSFFTKV